MEKRTEISNEAIKNMDLELAISILIDRRECGECSSCLCDNNKHEKYTCSKTSDAALKYLKEHLGELVTIENTPVKEEASEPSPVDISPYESTRSFMKERGYTRCYMCGSNLKGKEGD